MSAIPAGIVALLLLATGDALAQTGVEALYLGCGAGASSETRARCGDAALTLQALHGGLGLLASAGGVLPASPSTVGRRLAEQPRIVFDGGAVWASFRHPDLAAAPQDRGIPDRRALLVGGRLTTVVGIFEGFAPIPAAGGVLALDGVGTAQLLRLPRSDGFNGSVAGWGGGVRLGLVRESFSVPGVTLSAMHHRVGTVRFGEGADAPGARVRIDPRVTSLRAVVGKDLLAVGFAGGVGWDRYGGEGRIEVTAPSGDASAGPEGLRLTRRYLFAGVNFTWVVAQAAGELAWGRPASLFEEMEGTGPFRPGAAELQGAVTFRITY